MTRGERRGHFDQETRVALLEDDIDTIERTGLEMAHAIEEGKDAVRRLMWAMFTASLSLGIASILLAVDIARGR